MTPRSGRLKFQISMTTLLVLAAIVPPTTWVISKTNLDVLIFWFLPLHWVGIGFWSVAWIVAWLFVWSLLR